MIEIHPIDGLTASAIAALVITSLVFGKINFKKLQMA
jgi:hypothetical protein